MINHKSIAILVTFLPCLLLGQGTSTGSSQLKIPQDARTAALGEANVSDAGHLSAWLLNPANLYSRDAMNITLTHTQWIQDVQSEFLAAQIPVPFGTVGLGVSANSVAGIEIRDVAGPSQGTFNARFASLQLGIATPLFEKLALGLSAKYIYEKLYIDNATGYGVDIGLLYHTPLSGFDAAVSVTNAGSVQEFRQQRSDLPTFMRGGGTYHFNLDDFAVSFSAAVSGNLIYPETHALASLETTYNNLVSARVGYASGYDARGLSAGLGIRYEFLQFNYAFVPFSLGLGDGHLFSLGFQF
jgi:hypothetical protein